MRFVLAAVMLVAVLWALSAAATCYESHNPTRQLVVVASVR